MWYFSSSEFYNIIDVNCIFSKLLNLFLISNEKRNSIYLKPLLSKSESVKFSLIESVIDLFTDSSVNSRLCTKGGMVAIVTSAKCTRPSVARALFTRVTSPRCRSRYTGRFVSKLVEKVALRASAYLATGSQVSVGMNILAVEAGGMNIFGPWSGPYEHFAQFWRQGTIDCIPLYAQACNATFSARLVTKNIFHC